MSAIDRSLEMYDAVWASYNQLFDSMSEDDWSVQSLCPDWDARGAVTHVFGVEHALDNWFPETGETPPPFDKVAAYAELTAGMSTAEFVADCRRLMAARRKQIAALSDDDLAKPSMTPVGPGTYGRFLDIRVFDFWVHERDVRIPLSRPAVSDSDSAAERSLDEVAMSIGYIAGKKVGLTDGQSMSFRLTGPIERIINVAVDGRAKAVDTLENPDAVVTTDSTTFVMLACGRIDPQDQIDAGKISWSGDDELGERAARNLRFTM